MPIVKKPVREQDTLLVRVPDGIKDRIAQRARANGRSMSAEAAAILEQSMYEPADAEIEILARDALRCRVEIETATLTLRHAQQRLETITDELRRIFGPATRNYDPVDYALSVHLKKQSYERNKRKAREGSEPSTPASE